MPTGDQLHGMTETLERGAQMATTVSDNIQDHRTSLRPIVDALKGQWEGTARPAFDSAHAQWEAGIVRLIAALTHLGENTRYSSHTYDLADQASATAVHSAQGLAPFGGALQA